MPGFPARVVSVEDASRREAGSEVTAEIRLIWRAMRRTGSTLGRMRMMAGEHCRTITVSVPGTRVDDRLSSGTTHWRQFIAPMSR